MSTIAYTEKGQQVSLTSKIGGGGEGTVYASPLDPLECAKVYKLPASAETNRKLSLMVRRPPNDPTYQTRKHRSISWPTTLLYGDVTRSQLIGFFMPKIDLKAFGTAITYFDPTDRCTRFGGSFTWKHLFTSASNVVSAVAAIHDQGYCVGDFNESNVLVAPNALVSLIDCDSFQVPDSQLGTTYRCTVGKPEYTAPELIGKNLKEMDRTVASDAFALAVLIFQLLMEGTHPYQSKGRLVEHAASTQAKILLGYFPYSMRGRDIAPPDHAPPYEILHPDMQRFFHRCFATGHKDPQSRPTAHEWYQLLQKLETGFHQCRGNLNHFFLDHVRTCPWCEIRASSGREHFMPPVGQQVALDDAAPQLDSLEKRLHYLKDCVMVALADGILTNEKEDRLNDLAAKLRIPQKEVRNAIEAEAKRVKGKTGGVPGTPQLEVSQRSLDFANIRLGTKVSGNCVISNVGGGNLQGTIRSSQQWLKLSQTQIASGHHRQEVGFIVDTSGLSLGSAYSGVIEIRSNGGAQSIDVRVSIEVEESALSRFRLLASAIGFLVGGTFGCLLYMLIPDIPSRNAITGIVGLAGILGAILVGSRIDGFRGGCGSFLIAAIFLAVFERQWPVGYSGAAWALTFSSFLYACSRPLFVGKHAGKPMAFVATLVGGVCLVAAMVVAGTYVGSRLNSAKTSGKPVGQPKGPPPVIAEVSPILAERNQTITIRGHGFGTGPRLLQIGGGVVDTVSCNNPDPSIAVVNRGPGRERWSAGRSVCNDTNTIGIRVTSWNDSTIVLGGFGPILGTRHDPKLFLIEPGDPIEITVFGPGNSGSFTFKTVVKSAETSANVSNTKLSSPGTDSTSTPAVPADVARNAIRRVLDVWVESFRKKDVRTHVGCYAPVIQTYFQKHNLPNEELFLYKERAFAACTSVRQFEIADVNISPDSAEHYSATFRKKWDTPTTTKKIYAGEAIEKLGFGKFGSDWKIVSEEELRILTLVTH